LRLTSGGAIAAAGDRVISSTAPFVIISVICVNAVIDKMDAMNDLFALVHSLLLLTNAFKKIEKNSYIA